MTDFSSGIVLEARKKGLSQVSNKDGDFYRVSFDIHPDDASSELSKMKLGTRVYLVVTEIADDETPKPAAEQKPKGGERAKRAGILCNDPAFQRWIGALDAEEAADRVRATCGIGSRAELDNYSDCAKHFDDLVDEFYRDQRGDTEEARLTQRDRK